MHERDKNLKFCDKNGGSNMTDVKMVNIKIVLKCNESIQKEQRRKANSISCDFLL